MARGCRGTFSCFRIRDETLAPMAMRVASFFPVQAICSFNGHHFIEKDSAGRSVIASATTPSWPSPAPQARKAAADPFASAVIRKRLDSAAISYSGK